MSSGPRGQGRVDQIVFASSGRWHLQSSTSKSKKVFWFWGPGEPCYCYSYSIPPPTTQGRKVAVCIGHTPYPRKPKKKERRTTATGGEGEREGGVGKGSRRCRQGRTMHNDTFSSHLQELFCDGGVWRIEMRPSPEPDRTPNDPHLHRSRLGVADILAILDRIPDSSLI
eukprot:scaffold35022_cov33-Tisochrysis_lutea.AAC.1